MLLSNVALFVSVTRTRILDETGELNSDTVNEKWHWLRPVLLQTAWGMRANRPATPTSNGRGERQYVRKVGTGFEVTGKPLNRRFRPVTDVG